MSWLKLGLVFRPQEDIDWALTHATCPTPLQLPNGEVRVFFAARDALQRSHVGYFDIDLDDPERGVRVSTEPILSPGPLGCFDGNGIYVTSVVPLSGESVRLYTIGWNPGHVAPLFYATIGAAESEDMGQTIAWRSTVPIMDRSDHDPASVTGPWVLRDQGLFRMWYVSGQPWLKTETGIKSVYDVKYAESLDGIGWKRDGLVSIGFASPDEMNIARPCVLLGVRGYEVWFSYDIGEGYRIGYAQSTDGTSFQRKADSRFVIEPSDTWFEDQMVCHPAVVSHKGKRFMFYNGNRFGIDGVALAIEA